MYIHTKIYIFELPELAVEHVTVLVGTVVQHLVDVVTYVTYIYIIYIYSSRLNKKKVLVAEK
jgi:hypothetical protein